MDWEADCHSAATVVLKWNWKFTTMTSYFYKTTHVNIRPEQKSHYKYANIWWVNGFRNWDHMLSTNDAISTTSSSSDLFSLWRIYLLQEETTVVFSVLQIGFLKLFLYEHYYVRIHTCISLCTDLIIEIVAGKTGTMRKKEICMNFTTHISCSRYSSEPSTFHHHPLYHCGPMYYSITVQSGPLYSRAHDLKETRVVPDEPVTGWAVRASVLMDFVGSVEHDKWQLPCVVGRPHFS